MGMTRGTCVVAVLCGGISAALALSGDPLEPAKPDSRIVTKLLATPIPDEVWRVAYVAAALQMLYQPTAETFNDYLERSTWLDAIDEAPLKAATVGEAIAAEQKAEPLNAVRARAFAKILVAEPARPADVLPESVRADRDRFRQASPVVWDYVQQRDDAPTRLLHLALTNAGKRDVMGLRADLVIDANPSVTVQCALHPPSSASSLKAGQRRVMFCGTDWQKRVPLQTLVDAAQALADGKAAIRVMPQWILLDKAAFDLQQSGPGRYARRIWHGSGVDYSGRWQAAALVRESSCFDRGTCLDFLASQKKGGLGAFVWFGLVAGVLVFAAVAAASRLRVPVKAMAIVSLILALLPVLAFAALMGNNSLGWGIFIPVLGAYLWIAWAVGFWGAWLLALPLLRRAAKRREVDDTGARDGA